MSEEPTAEQLADEAAAKRIDQEHELEEARARAANIRAAQERMMQEFREGLEARFADLEKRVGKLEKKAAPRKSTKKPEQS